MTEARAIANIINRNRLIKYTEATQSLEEAISLYEWNAKVSAAFMLPLNYCEVSLRNGISEALSNTYGVDWYTQDTFHRSLTNSRNPRAFNPRNEAIAKSQKYQTVGKAIAEYKFVFWEHLLTQRYYDRVWHRNFSTIFPNITAPTQQAGLNRVRDNIEKIRKIRNRVAHHEPIFTRNLQDELDRILEIIEWRCDYTIKRVLTLETVSSILARCP